MNLAESKPFHLLNEVSRNDSLLEGRIVQQTEKIAANLRGTVVDKSVVFMRSLSTMLLCFVVLTSVLRPCHPC